MKTFPCCFCNEKFNRYNLAKHIEKKHDEEVPHNLTPYRLAYDIINNHPDHHGSCVVCGADTNWNEKTSKYFRVCKNPKCYEEIKKTYQERMLKVYNKIYLTQGEGSEQHLEKMLAGRKISGKYKWSDGSKEFTYTGSYEKKLLEFLDTCLNYDSKDIITPGPILVYTFEGKEHKWITDCMIASLGLIIEVKDGEDNKNNRISFDCRQKQLAKEKAITSGGKFSYLRLTNNNFGQLLHCIAEIKENINEDNDKVIYHINEAVNGINIYEAEADRLNNFAEMAEKEFDMLLEQNQFLRPMTYKLSGIFTDPCDTNHDVFSIAAIIPQTEEEASTYLETVEQIVDILNQDPIYENYDLLWRYTGYFADKDNPLDGYIIGIQAME